MMTASQLRDDLERQGLTIVPTADGLRVTPESRLTPVLRAMIAAKKRELTAMLRAEAMPARAAPAPELATDRTASSSDHPDPAGVDEQRQPEPAEARAMSRPAILADEPIRIGSMVVVIDVLSVVDPTPTSVHAIRTTAYDLDAWALLDDGFWRPLRDLRVVATPAEAPS